MSVKQRERWFLLLNMLRFTYLVSVEIFFFFSLCNEYFRKRGVLDQRHNLRCLIYSCSADSGHFASICVNLYIFKWKQVLTPLKALLAAVNHRGRLCCPFRNAMGTESLGLGRGGGATRFQSWWSFRDKVIMLIIPRSFFFFFFAFELNTLPVSTVVAFLNCQFGRIRCMFRLGELMNENIFLGSF